MLKIYDALRNEIIKLINEQKGAGYYEIEFDTSSFASGIYFYRMQAISFIETKKMVFLR